LKQLQNTTIILKFNRYVTICSLFTKIKLHIDLIKFNKKIVELGEKLGKLVVYNPYAELHHYESKSRGLEDSPEKVERFNGETEILLSFWRDLIESGDPYYNCNLTLDNSDFSLRR